MWQSLKCLQGKIISKNDLQAEIQAQESNSKFQILLKIHKFCP